MPGSAATAAVNATNGSRLLCPPAAASAVVEQGDRDEHVLEPGGGSRTGDGGDRFERRRPLGNRMVSDRKADSNLTLSGDRGPVVPDERPCRHRRGG